MFGPKYAVVYGKIRKGRVIVAIAIIGLLYWWILSDSARGAFVGSILLLPALAFLIWAFRRPRFTTNPKGRHGLLNAIKRPPLTKYERLQLLSDFKEGAQRHALMERADASQRREAEKLAQRGQKLNFRQGPKTSLQLIDMEVVRLVQLWHRGAEQPLSDDEMRSIGLLYRVGLSGSNKQLPDIGGNDQAMIGDWDTINALRDRVMVLNNAKQAKKTKQEADRLAHVAWLEKVGDPDASGYVCNGWLPLLQAFDPPDIKLWHNVANTFHDLRQHELAAAYWILAQPACDKATAYGFMVGYVGYEDLRRVLEDARREARSVIDAAQPFVDVINRWNVGFYRWHSLAHDEDETPNEHLDEAAAVNDALMVLSAEFEVRLPLIMYIDFDPMTPVDDLSRSQDSRLEYCDGHPLQLGFPHMWPKELDRLG